MPHSESHTHEFQCPLCVDLDGTLIRTDLLLESFLVLIKGNPFYVFLIPFWLLRGKAALKAAIADRVQIDPSTLPYHQPFLAWLRIQAQRGRVIYLCTASNNALVTPIAAYLGIFAGVMASDGLNNLSGSKKADRLVRQFGEKGFDYCGNASVDLAVWAHAQGAIVVDGGESLAKMAAQLTRVVGRFDSPKCTLKTVLKAIRLHQWAKNLLIFIPLLAAHRLQEAELLANAGLAFIAFGLCASSVYLLNDLLDLGVDRLHPRKCKRPFASGQMSLLTGIYLFPLMLIIGFGLALILPLQFLAVLGVYYFLTVTYSFDLKRIVLVDVLTLAALYTVRLVAGAAAVGVALSFWLLLFSFFLFLSLALVKRYAELYDLRSVGALSAAGRGYHVEDLPVLQNLGTAAGYLSVLVLALYINSTDVLNLYRQPEWIWGLCGLLLFWISRVWLLAHRGDMHDDPVVFALRDRGSQMVGLLAALCVWLAV